jgi:hypothetical protein
MYKSEQLDRKKQHQVGFLVPDLSCKDNQVIIKQEALTTYA